MAPRTAMQSHLLVGAPGALNGEVYFAAGNTSYFARHLCQRLSLRRHSVDLDNGISVAQTCVASWRTVENLLDEDKSRLWISTEEDSNSSSEMVLGEINGMINRLVERRRCMRPDGRMGAKSRPDQHHET